MGLLVACFYYCKADPSSRKYGSIEQILSSDGLPKNVLPPLDTEAYLTEIKAARAIFLSPIPVDGYSASDFDLKPEDPNLFSMIRGFGLDTEMANTTQCSGFELQEGGLDLGDTPYIPGGSFEPFPGQFGDGSYKL